MWILFLVNRTANPACINGEQATTPYQIYFIFVFCRSLSLVQSRSLTALQNLLTVLPLDRWGGGRGDGCGLVSIWTSLFTHCSHCSDAGALTGVLQVVAEKMTESEARVSYLSLSGSLCLSF